MPSIIEIMEQDADQPAGRNSVTEGDGNSAQPGGAHDGGSAAAIEGVAPDPHQLLAHLPENASGAGMSAEKYQALRRYISRQTPARLVHYCHGIGTVTGIAPPRELVPAGTITMVCEDGSHVDCDSRCFKYPTGEPVADEFWIAYDYDPDDQCEVF